MGKAVAVQQAFRFRNDDGSQTSATWMSAGNNVNQSIGTGTDNRFRVRIVVEETAGGSYAVGATLYYSKNSGAYTDISTASSNIRAIASKNTTWTISDDDSTTAQLGYSGTFVTGYMDTDGGSTSNATISSQYTEFEFVLYLVDADLQNGDTIDLRVYDAGVAIDSYQQVPRITVSKATTVSGSITANAAIEKSWSGSVSADSVIEGPVDSSITADALVVQSRQGSVTADAKIYPVYPIDIDFEEGDLSDFESTSGDVVAASGAALAGTSYGMEVTMDGLPGEDYGVITVGSPPSGQFSIRLYIDPNSIATLGASGTYLVNSPTELFGSAATYGVVGIQFMYGATYQLRVFSKDDEENWNFNTTIVSDAPHWIEGRWTRESADGQADGTIEWWIDGVAQTTVTGIDNYNYWEYLDELWIGNGRNNSDTGDGTFYVDEIVIRDDGARIGGKISGSIAASATIARSVSNSVVADSVIEGLQSGSVTADSSIENSQVGSITSYATVESSFSGSITADSVIAGAIAWGAWSEIWQNTVASAITADSVIEKAQTGSVTADSVIRRTEAGSVDVDAAIQGSITGTASVDAAIKRYILSDISADSIIRRIESGSITADSTVKASKSQSLIVDSVVQKSISSDIPADAVIKTTLLESITVDSAVQRSGVGFITSDSTIRRLESGSITADAYIAIGGVEDSITADATIESGIELSITADSYILGAGQGSVAVDAVIMRTLESSITANAAILRHESYSVTTDSTIERTVADSFSGDATIESAKTGSITADGWIELSQTGSVTADATIETTTASSITADSYISTVGVDSIFADAAIQRGSTGSITANAIILRGIASSVNADAVIKASIEESVTASAVIESLFAESIAANAAIERSVQNSIIAYAAIGKAVQGSVSSDATIHVTVAASISADSIIGKTISQSVSLDATVFATPEQSVTADAYIVCVGKPIWVSPENGSTIGEYPTFVFEIPWSASNVHFTLELDTVDTFDSGSYRKMETFASQSGWEYWDGGAWQPFPSGGVSNTYAGNECRYTVSVGLTPGTWYRTVQGSVG